MSHHCLNSAENLLASEGLKHAQVRDIQKTVLQKQASCRTES